MSLDRSILNDIVTAAVKEVTKGDAYADIEKNAKKVLAVIKKEF